MVQFNQVVFLAEVLFLALGVVLIQLDHSSEIGGLGKLWLGDSDLDQV
jgi:hypothetical protein